MRLSPHRISALCVLSLTVISFMAPIAIAQEIPISGTIGDTSSSASSDASSPVTPPPPPPSDSGSSSSVGGIIIPPILPPQGDPGTQPPPADSSSSSVAKKKGKGLSSSVAPVKQKKTQPPTAAASSSSVKPKKAPVATPPATSSSEQAAEAGSVQYILRPHCTNSDQSTCNTFDTITPVQLQTPPYGKGDVIDIDVVALNPNHLPIKRVRAWIVYDSSVLDGKSIAATKDFSATTPTEEEFVPEEGYAKFQAETGSPLSDDIVPIAEVKFVLHAPDPSGKSILGFDDQSDDAPHTYAYSNAKSTSNLISPSDLGVVAVVTQDSAPEHAAAGSENTPESSGSGRTTFVLLQPQNVRITTAKDTVYVAWDSLPSPDLVGYNVYYSTVSGRYIQRRTVTPDATGIALQSLPINSVYFVAVRGINASNEETAFSQEVAVKVGMPSSSTSPFVASAIRPSTTSNPLMGTHMAAADASVPGASGLPTLLSLALVASAVAGTFIAVRRQRNLSYRIAP